MLYQVRRAGGYFKTISTSSGPLGAAKRFQHERSFPPNTQLEVIDRNSHLRRYVVTDGNVIRPEGISFNA